jgi:hypothetical protein
MLRIGLNAENLTWRKNAVRLSDRLGLRQLSVSVIDIRVT